MRYESESHPNKIEYQTDIWLMVLQIVILYHFESVSGPILYLPRIFAS